MKKNSVLELQIDHLYTTCNQELIISKIKFPFPLCYLQSSIRDKTVPSLQTGKNTQPTAMETEGRFLTKGAFTRETLCEICDLLISSELVLLLMVSRSRKYKVLSTLLQHHINLYIHEEIQAFTHLYKLVTTNFTPLYLHLYLQCVKSIKYQADIEPLTAP